MAVFIQIDFEESAFVRLDRKELISYGGNDFQNAIGIEITYGAR